MTTHSLLFLIEKIELLGNVFIDYSGRAASFILNYFTLFIVVAKGSTEFKLFQKVSNCRYYRQIISDDSLSDLVDQIKKIHGV